MNAVEIARTLARIEAKLDAVIGKQEDQEDHNAKFYNVRDKVHAMEAKAAGVWLASGVFGAFGAWVVSLFRH